MVKKSYTIRVELKGSFAKDVLVEADTLDDAVREAVDTTWDDANCLPTSDILTKEDARCVKFPEEDANLRCIELQSRTDKGQSHRPEMDVWEHITSEADNNLTREFHCRICNASYSYDVHDLVDLEKYQNVAFHDHARQLASYEFKNARMKRRTNNA